MIRVRSLGGEDPLEEGLATYSSTLAWRIPWTEEPGRLQSMGWQRVGHDRASEQTHTHSRTDISESFETMFRHIISLQREKTFFCQRIQRFSLITGKIESSMNGNLSGEDSITSAPCSPAEGIPQNPDPPPPLSCSCDTAQEHEGAPTYLLSCVLRPTLCLSRFQGWSASSSITWVLIRHADSQASSQTY